MAVRPAAGWPGPIARAGRGIIPQPRSPRVRSRTISSPRVPVHVLLAALVLPGLSRAQAPAPAIESAPRTSLVEHGLALLEHEDPLAAIDSLRLASAVGTDEPAILVGLGRAHLLLGEAEVARRYALAALAEDADDDGALALRVRSLLRERHFREAVDLSARLVAAGRGGVETLAAHGSALFRVQRNEEAAAVYRRVLTLDPDHAEAHLRLGSGLTSPCQAPIGVDLHAAIDELGRQHLDDAVSDLHAALRSDPDNPIAHRLLGETLFEIRSRDSMASTASEYRRLYRALPWPPIDFDLAREFMPAYPSLSPQRRRVAARALALFQSRLPELIRKNGRHDLLLEGERTTDAGSRASLRGKRTFDGRVWDDVRGIGGLRAATGIEALDEAAQLGFDTLSHELAHQVHLYALRDRALADRIKQLYHQALAEGRCLDYYAASNHAEYFGQGVEAFASLGKRPTSEATHGHTRFELMRVDPALYEFIRGLVDFDPLAPDADPAVRTELLDASILVALRCGRPEDAVTAAEMLPAGALRERRLAEARRATLLARSL